MLIGNMLCKNIFPFINSALSTDKKVSIVLNGLLYAVVIQLRSCRVNPLVCSQMFYKIDVLKTFAIFTGKHLRWILFLIKLQTPEKKRTLAKKETLANWKRDTGTGVFCEFREIFTNTFFYRTILETASVCSACTLIKGHTHLSKALAAAKGFA